MCSSFARASLTRDQQKSMRKRCNKKDIQSLSSSRLCSHGKIEEHSWHRKRGLYVEYIKHIVLQQSRKCDFEFQQAFCSNSSLFSRREDSDVFILFQKFTFHIFSRPAANDLIRFFNEAFEQVGVANQRIAIDKKGGHSDHNLRVQSFFAGISIEEMRQSGPASLHRRAVDYEIRDVFGEERKQVEADERVGRKDQNRKNFL
mmetsp:Transcript_9154/g.13737  ORF Transcript_9154/g.13737 Transcript_9154/m.13737 type:complete len:202 (-) Transcript_9154:279-884(-)